MPLFDLKAEIIIDDVIAIRLADSLQSDDFLSTTRWLRKAKAHRGLVGFRSLDAHHTTELLDAILCLCGFAGFGAEAIDEIFQMGDFFLLVAIGGELLFLPRLF